MVKWRLLAGLGLAAIAGSCAIPPESSTTPSSALFPKSSTSLTPSPILPVEPVAITAPTSSRVYVLTYHSISDKGTSFTIVTKAMFRRQLEILKREKRKLVGIQDLLGFVRGELDLPDGSVVISFDDGYESTKDAALLVEQYGGRAALFVYTNYVNRGGITWANLKSLKARGHEIQSHTLSHLSLPTLNDDAFARETIESERLLREHLGESDGLRILAYPFGFYNEKTIELLTKNGTYRGALTIRPGPVLANDDPLRIHRDMIRRGISDEEFLRIINAKSLGDLKITWNEPLVLHLQSDRLEKPKGQCKAIVNDIPSNCAISGGEYQIRLNSVPKRPQVGVELEVIDETRGAYRGGEVVKVFDPN